MVRFWRFKILNCIFWTGGRGREGQINKYVGGYDEIIFFTFWGVISINLGLFYGQGTDLGLLNFKYFLGMPDIPDIFGDRE